MFSTLETVTVGVEVTELRFACNISPDIVEEPSVDTSSGVYTFAFCKVVVI